MRTTLRIDGGIYRRAEAEAARRGITLTAFVEEALLQQIEMSGGIDAVRQSEIEERDRVMEALLRATAHFRVGPKPSREEMSER